MRAIERFQEYYVKKTIVMSTMKMIRRISCIAVAMPCANCIQSKMAIRWKFSESENPESAVAADGLERRSSPMNFVGGLR